MEVKFRGTKKERNIQAYSQMKKSNYLFVLHKHLDSIGTTTPTPVPGNSEEGLVRFLLPLTSKPEPGPAPPRARWLTAEQTLGSTL